MRNLIRWLFVFSAVALVVHGAELVVAGKSVPDRIRPQLLVLSADWVSQIPPTERVNVPTFFSTLYPGQKIAVGLIAEGPGRERMFNDVRVSVRFAEGGGESRDLKPVAIRAIKAEGADFALMALKAGGISDVERSKMEATTSLVTLAVFAADWTAPTVKQAMDVELSMTLSGTADPVKIEPGRLKIRGTKDWLAGPPPSQEEVGKQMNRFQEDVAPGQLLSWFGVVAKNGSLKAVPVHGFFASVFKSNPAARAAAVELYATLDAEVQRALLWVLKLGGHDLKELFPALPAQTIASLKAVEPLADPRQLPRFQDPVDSQAVSQIGQAMDRCWGAWMATGDKSYLRALVDLLEGAADFPVFKTWQDSRGGAKGMNAQVARGLAYQIAGWSIGSFGRTDPHVADWLSYWQKDPTVSATVRREIDALPANPAFRRK